MVSIRLSGLCSNRTPPSAACASAWEGNARQRIDPADHHPNHAGCSSKASHNAVQAGQAEPGAAEPGAAEPNAGASEPVAVTASLTQEEDSLCIKGVKNTTRYKL